MPTSGYCVYEAVSPAHDEVIIGVTDADSLERIADEHKKYPPVWMAKWVEEAEYRWMACAIDREDALRFAEVYAKSASLRPLKVHIIG